MGGKAMAPMVYRQGSRRDFEVEAGVEHGCDPLTEEVLIFPFMGTILEGSHIPGHYYFEKEKYMPTLVVRKDPLEERSGSHA